MMMAIGLSITGMAIAGKPGGLVCEGVEADVVNFMTVSKSELGPKERMEERTNERPQPTSHRFCWLRVHSDHADCV